MGYCNRTFAREAVIEGLPGYGAVEILLSRTPIITVSAVYWDSTTLLTDWSLRERDRGVLFRQLGWWWTRQVNVGLSGRQRWPGFGQPIPDSEEDLFTFTYVGGFILPTQNLEAVATVSVASGDSSFNDSANGFPSLLQSGDVICASGFSNAANNGRFQVTGTPTAGKIQVSATLVTEGASAGRTIAFEPPPEARSFDNCEKAAIETVKTWYLRKAQDGQLVEKKVGQIISRVPEDIDLITLGIPPSAVGLLKPYVRAA